VRAASCVVLCHLGAAARPAIPELIRILREDHVWFVRTDAAWAIGNIANGEDKLVVEALVAATKDTNAALMATAGTALTRLNPEAAVKAGVTNVAPGTWPPSNPAGAVR